MLALVVDDDAATRKLVSVALTCDGFRVATSASGDEALARIESTPDLALLVLDWSLPDVDGLTVCRELRYSGASLPVLMLSGRTAVGERILALNTGVDDFMTKPFAVAELRARARALVRGFRWRAAG
jgi:DNA-binding response OmpR family regulator